MYRQRKTPKLIEMLNNFHHYPERNMRGIGIIASDPKSNEKEEAFQVIMQWLEIQLPQLTSAPDRRRKLRFIEEQKERTQFAAIAAAGDIGDERASDLLFELMKQKYPDQIEPIIALGKLGDSRIIDELTEMLELHYSGVKGRFKQARGIHHQISVGMASFEDIIGWLSNIDKEYTFSKIVEYTTKNSDFSKGLGKATGMIPLIKSAKALCEIGGIVALGEAIRMSMSPARYNVKEWETNVSVSSGIISLLSEQDANEVGAAYEHLGLFEEAEKWYTDKGLFDETARVRKLIAEMGAAKVSQKVVQGDENITINRGDENILIQDSVVTESSVGGIQATDMLGQLERLGQMKEKGLLTDDEFALAKQKLLDN